MAFKRNGFKSLIRNGSDKFVSAYKFSKKIPFKVGSDAYIIILGLESGFYETACHRVMTHKAANGAIVGFNSAYSTYIKCKGVDENGNLCESLCCQLSSMEKERIPDREESAKRIITYTNYRTHLPVLILGNSLTDNSKISYPITKVSILNDLRSEKGLKFAYLDMASDTFKSEILQAYGKKLKEEGVLDYEMDEEGEEFLEEVCKRLTRTVVKVQGVSKPGFEAAMKEYSFFPFDNPTIASASPAGEREAILGYKENQEIQNKICEFLDLFNVEVDNMVQDWSEKELQDYYNSAVHGTVDVPNSTPNNEVAEQPKETVEKVEVIETPKAEPTPVQVKAVVQETPKEEPKKQISDEDLDSVLKDPFKGDNKESEPELDEFEFDSSDEESFFEED